MGAKSIWVGGLRIICNFGLMPDFRLQYDWFESFKSSFLKKIKYFRIFQGTNKCDPKHVLNTFRSNFNKNCVELWFRVRKTIVVRFMNL